MTRPDGSMQTRLFYLYVKKTSLKYAYFIFCSYKIFKK